MCQSCPTIVEPATDFAAKLVETYNAAALSLMISIGHRTGLFDAMANLGRTTSEELAATAKLEERYVREWLGAMTCGGIVRCTNDVPARFDLPRAHADCLTRAAGPANLAPTSQYIAVLGAVEDEVVQCFRRGGGVPYSRFPRFHAVMAEESGATVLPELTRSILPLVPGAMDRLERGIDLLDVGCGSARALNQLAQQFPASNFAGYDLSDEAILAGRAEAWERNSLNLRLLQRDLSNFHEDAVPEAFDIVTAFDAIHDQGRPDRVLAGIHRTLRPGGTFLMQDINTSSYPHLNVENPLGTFIYTISCMHCMTVSLAQGGMGLGAAWGRERALRMLREAGFAEVTVHELPHDVLNCYYVARKRP